MDDYDEFIVEAMDRGWVEPVFKDDGEVVMRITPDKDNPLWQEHLKSVGSEVSKLVEKGLVEMAGVNEKGDVVYRLTEEGQKFYE